MSGEYHKLDGDTANGHSAEFVVGFDKLISPNTILGFTIGIEDLDFGGSDVRSVAYGPYFATRFANGMMLDGLLTYAEPDYTGATTATGERVSAALNFAGGSYDLAAGVLTPYINLSAFDEDLSTGVSIDQRRVIAGGRFDFATDGAMQPFVRAAVDYKKTTNSSTGSDSYTHPLLGLGLNGTLGGGQLSSEIGYSRYNSTTRDLSLQFRYEMNF